MADFSLRDAWWLQPEKQDNPLPALQLGVHIVQRKAQQDLQERKLANELAVISLRREEMLYKQQLQTDMEAGNVAVAGTIASITDWSDPASISRVWSTVSRYPMTAESKAVQGAEYMHRHAVAAKQRQYQADERSDIARARLELQELLNDSRIELNDARILELQNDIAFGERRMAVQEGNLALRGQEIQQKGKKLSLRSQRMYDNELKALNNEEASAIKNVTDQAEVSRQRKLYNLKRRELTNKFYSDTDTAPPATTPPTQRVAPAETPQVRRQGGNLFQLQQDGSWKFIGPAQ